MCVGLGERLAGAHRDCAQQPDRRDARANPCAVFGLDLACRHVQDVRPHGVDGRANLVAIIRERQHNAARAWPNRREDLARCLGADSLGDDSGLGHHHADMVGARLGSRDRVRDRRHAVDLHDHLLMFLTEHRLK
jgi:hypothetical protein